MGLEYLVTSPLYLPDGTRAEPNRKYALNLNDYRNTCHMKLNNMKVKYKEVIGSSVEAMIPLKGQVEITYKLFMPTRRKCDISNICSVVDKFFCDALVSYGVIEDDNYNYLPRIVYEWGGVDKQNPRMEITIQEIS